MQADNEGAPNRGALKIPMRSRPIQLQLVDTECRNRSETIPDTTLLRNMFSACVCVYIYIYI